MQTIRSVGDDGRHVLTGRPVRVLEDSRERRWISILDGWPLVYDPATDSLKDFAKRGGGPGEFSDPFIMALLPGDSIMVHDGATRVLRPDFTTAREITADNRLGGVQVEQWPSRVLAATHPYDMATRTGRHIVARYDLTTDIAVPRDTLYASDVVDSRLARPGIDPRRFAGWAAPGGAIWLYPRNAYQLTLCNAEGNVTDSIVRRPRWFPGHQPDRIGGAGRPSAPHMIGTWVDEQERLWALAAKPRKDTRDAWNSVASASGPARELSESRMPAEHQLYTTLIEVFDVAARRVLARHEFDGYIVSVLPSGRVASYVETAEGIPVLTIHQLSLRGVQ